MPKVYLTYAERAKAQIDRDVRKQEDELIGILTAEKKRKKFSFDDIARLVGSNRVTVANAFREPGTARVAMLRDICFVLGVRYEFSATPI